MDANALKQSSNDYGDKHDYIQWSGRAPVVALPMQTPDLRDINLSEVWLATDRELRFWTGELGVTIYEIREAIAATGTRCASAVRQYLGRAVG